MCTRCKDTFGPGFDGKCAKCWTENCLDCSSNIESCIKCNATFVLKFVPAGGRGGGTKSICMTKCPAECFCNDAEFSGCS